MLRPVAPALHAEGPAARLAQELSLGVGEHVEAEVLSDLGLVPALRGDVDQLQGSRGEAIGEPGHRRSVPRHNPRTEA